MNLEQALHQRWADSPALAALLPAQHVTTGRSTGAELPCATITRRSRRTICHSNSGDTLEEVSVEILLRHPNFDDAAAIVQQLLAAFDRSQFDLSSGAKVLHLRRTEEHSQQLDDNSWQFQIQFLARIHLLPPDP